MRVCEIRILYPDLLLVCFGLNIQTWFLLDHFHCTNSTRNQQNHRCLCCPGRKDKQLWCEAEKYIVDFFELFGKLFLDVGFQEDVDQTLQISISENQTKRMPYLTRSGAFSLWTPKSSTIFSRRISSLLLLFDMLYQLISLFKIKQLIQNILKLSK